MRSEVKSVDWTGCVSLKNPADLSSEQITIWTPASSSIHLLLSVLKTHLSSPPRQQFCFPSAFQTAIPQPGGEKEGSQKWLLVRCFGAHRKISCCLFLLCSNFKVKRAKETYSNETRLKQQAFFRLSWLSGAPVLFLLWQIEISAVKKSLHLQKHS